MDRTIITLLALCLILLLLSIGIALEKDKLEKELVTVYKMVKENCNCRPWR